MSRGFSARVSQGSVPTIDANPGRGPTSANGANSHDDHGNLKPEKAEIFNHEFTRITRNCFQIQNGDRLEALACFVCRQAKASGWRVLCRSRAPTCGQFVPGAFMLRPIMQNGGVRIRAVPPNQGLEFRVEPDGVEHFRIAKRPIKSAPQHRLKVNEPLHVIVKSQPQPAVARRLECRQMMQRMCHCLNLAQRLNGRNPAASLQPLNISANSSRCNSAQASTSRRSRIGRSSMANTASPLAETTCKWGRWCRSPASANMRMVRP
jgi:hypothetical protein